MLFDIFTWSLTVASLLGMWLNVRHRPECFIVWGYTNISWAVVDAMHGIWSQAVLQLVYLCFGVYGYRKWLSK